MKIKKKYGILLISLIIISTILPLISAYSFGYIDLRYGANQVIDTATEFASPFFEVLIGDYSGSEFFLAKCLLLIMLYIVISSSLVKTKIVGLNENKGALFIVSAAISILAIRFIPETDVIRAMILPYSALGIAISILLPFIIFGFFLHKSDIGAVGRRFGWITYIIIFIVLWTSRSAELSPLGNQIYLWMLIAAIAMLILDKQIHNQLGIHEIQAIYNDQHNKRINTLLLRRGELESKMPTTEPGKTRFIKEIEGIDKEIRRLTRSI